MQAKYDAEAKRHCHTTEENQHLQQMSSLCKATAEHTKQIAAQKQVLQDELTLLRTQHTNNQRFAADNELLAKHLREKTELLQAQHAAAVDQLTASLQQSKQQLEDCNREKQELQRNRERVQDVRRHRKIVVAIAGQRLKVFRSSISEIQHKTAAHLQEFQQQVESYMTQLNQLAIAPQKLGTPDRIREFAKLEAFDLWV